MKLRDLGQLRIEIGLSRRGGRRRLLRHRVLLGLGVLRRVLLLLVALDPAGNGGGGAHDRRSAKKWASSS